MLKLCDLDPETYSCILTDIRTTEVVITEERIEHIKERHPGDYERFCSYIPEIIHAPDYIVASKLVDTAVILREFVERGEKFKLILRLKTSDMPDGYKNSVISFWCVGETTWKKTLKNKKILYKKE